MKKLLTLLLVFSFAFSATAFSVAHKSKPEKPAIEKSIVKVNFEIVAVEVLLNKDVLSPQATESIYQHRFKQESYLYNFKSKNIQKELPKNSTYCSKLPDKIT
ncbi:hypothetical protein [Flavobacterium sp. FlaQc-50]|uniref:hypothetical protein n=1 Tax=unclassified Flavobacterium TaxID=196869 RepID=UPI0037582CF7